AHEYGDFVELRPVSGFHLATLDRELSVLIDDLLLVLIKAGVCLSEVECPAMNVAFQTVFAGQFFREDSGLGIAILSCERGAHDEPRPCGFGYFKVLVDWGVGFRGL
ncbi:MAG: hypothetical protein ACK5Z0_05780, partial [Planctomycetota bacterium]